MLIDLRAEGKRTDFAALRVNGIHIGYGAIAITLHLTDEIGLAAVHTLLTIRFLFFVVRNDIVGIGIQLLG